MVRLTLTILSEIEGLPDASIKILIPIFDLFKTTKI